MTNKKLDDSVIDAEEIIGLSLLKNHTHFLMGDIDDENIEIVINSPRVSKLLNKDKIMCHSRETAHVLKQLINDYLYTKKQSKIANYFS